MNNKESKNVCSDEELMEAFKLGYSEAFDMLYKRYSSRLYSYLRKRISDDDTSKEVFQDIFLKLYQSKGSFKNGTLFSPWLFSIARNSLIDKLRKIKLEQDSLKKLEEVHYQHDSMNWEMRFDSLIASLSEREKNILSLKFKKDMTFHKISQFLGISPENVRKIASRALKHLRGSEI